LKGENKNKMKVNLRNLGNINKNCVTILTDKGSVDLYFSYETLVGVDNIISINNWGQATGKLLNELQPDKSKRVLHEEVLKTAENRLKQILYTPQELIAEKL